MSELVPCRKVRWAWCDTVEVNLYGVPWEVRLFHSDIRSVPGADPIFRLCVDKGERQRERDFERGRLLLVVIAVFRKVHALSVARSGCERPQRRCHSNGHSARHLEYAGFGGGRVDCIFFDSSSENMTHRS